MRKTIYLIASILWILLSFIIAINLYLLPYSKMDNIEPSYSPELDQNITTQRILFWGFIIFAIIIELFIIKKYKSYKATQ